MGGAPDEGCLNVLAQVTAALNTDLDNAITELAETRERLEARIAQLEARLAGNPPPPEEDEDEDEYDEARVLLMDKELLSNLEKLPNMEGK